LPSPRAVVSSSRSRRDSNVLLKEFCTHWRPQRTQLPIEYSYDSPFTILLASTKDQIIDLVVPVHETPRSLSLFLLTQLLRASCEIGDHHLFTLDRSGLFSVIRSTSHIFSTFGRNRGGSLSLANTEETTDLTLVEWDRDMRGWSERGREAEHIKRQGGEDRKGSDGQLPTKMMYKVSPRYFADYDSSSASTYHSSFSFSSSSSGNSQSSNTFPSLNSIT